MPKQKNSNFKYLITYPLALFGKDFLKQRKYGFLIINNKIREFKRFKTFVIHNYKKEILTIKLMLFSRLANMDRMFYGCESLLSISCKSNWRYKVGYMKEMFCGCSSLISLSGISNWNTTEVVNMERMFYGCPLISLPDISKWDTSNVINMNSLFIGCSSLISMPDISKWNTKNVKTMQCN